MKIDSIKTSINKFIAVGILVKYFRNKRINAGNNSQNVGGEKLSEKIYF